MHFEQLALRGVFVIDQERRQDARGFFSRTFCQNEFRRHGLFSEICQVNTSFNRHKGTLRGMHHQRAPHQEAKVVRCTRGAVFDVIVDLRDDSPTRHRWISVELSAENGRQLYIPAGFAHGFQTLEHQSELLYLMSNYYVPGDADGVRYDDPILDIRWPLPIASISEQDNSWPALVP